MLFWMYLLWVTKISQASITHIRIKSLDDWRVIGHIPPRFAILASQVITP